MNLTDIMESMAESLIEMYGMEKALKVANDYAAECDSTADRTGLAKWSAIAAYIAELIQMDAKYNKPTRN
jgi:hypothetical protein